MPIALKEWAVTVRALAEGEQLLTLRPALDGEEAPFEHDQFFLFPNFDEQRNDLIRGAHQPELRCALEEGVWPDGEPPLTVFNQPGVVAQPDRVRVRAWAEVAASWTISDPRMIHELSPFYVWTTDYAEKRLRWRRRQPLHVVLLRAHRIPRPVTVRAKTDFGDSFVEIARDLPFEGTPVLADSEFDRAYEEISRICGAGVPALA